MKAPVNIAFLTGQSCPMSCALSPEQTRFLEQLGRGRHETIQRNFPYRASPAYRHVPLLLASWRNLRGYYASRRAGFAAEYRNDVETLIARAERTIFLAGSSGLELFNNLGLAAQEERRCLLICFGPVARRLPHHAETLLVQGSRDFMSRLFFPRVRPALNCGHMDYLREPAFLAFCREQIARRTSLSCTNISA